MNECQTETFFPYSMTHISKIAQGTSPVSLFGLFILCAVHCSTVGYTGDTKVKNRCSIFFFVLKNALFIYKGALLQVWPVGK